MTESSRPLFIYFDAVNAYGVLNGAIQIELVANVLRAEATGRVEGVKADAGHIRCSPAAAADLLLALQSALKMLENQHQAPAATVN